MKKLTTAITILLFLLMPVWAFGTTYYVDNTCTDTNVASATVDGTAYDPATPACTGGSDSYFVTIADLNAAAATTAPGDSILFRKGQTWREQLTVPESGSAGNVYTYGAFGSGADPIISGADLKTDPTNWRGYIHSDGFETNDLSYWDSTNTAGTNTIAASSSANHTGTYGLRATYDGTNEAANVQVDLVALSSDITIEFEMRLSSDYGQNGTFLNHRIVELTSTGTNRAGISIREQAEGDYRIYAELHGPWVAIESGSLSLNTWYTVKLRYVVDAATGGIQLWLDGGSVGSDFARDTSGDTINRYFLGGNASGSTYPDANADIDFDVVEITVGDSVNTDAYRTTATVNADVRTAIQDGSALTRNSTSIATLTEGQFYLDGSNYLWVFPTGSGNPAQYVVEIPVRNTCITLDNDDYITLDGLTLQGALYYGIHLDNGVDYPIIDNCTVQFSSNTGLMAYDADHTADSTNIVIEDSIFSYNFVHGVSLLDDIDTVTVSRNKFHHNSTADAAATDSGLYIKADPGNETQNVTVEENEAYSNGGPTYGNGIYLDTLGTQTVLKYNYTHDNVTNGIVVELTASNELLYNISESNGVCGISLWRGSDTNLVYGNTVWGNGGNGIQLDDEGEVCDDNIVKNNISFGNTGYDLFADDDCANADGGSGNVYEYNGFGAESSNFIYWNDTAYSTYDTWLVASSQTTNSVEADPLFINAGSDDFTLQAGSPAIDTGIIPSGFESIFPLNPTLTVIDPYAPVVATKDYGAREIGAFTFIPAYAPMGLGMGMNLSIYQGADQEEVLIALH